MAEIPKLSPDPYDLTWIKSKFGDDYEVEYDTASVSGGLSANMKRIQLTHKSNEAKKFYVLKTYPLESLDRSKQLGLPRESLFYELLANRLREMDISLPNVVYSYGDMTTGQKAIILEDLTDECVQAGYFFGPGSPHNWGKDLDMLLSKAVENDKDKSATLISISQEAFVMAARLHARFWQDTSLLEHEWLRSSNWLKNESEQTWINAQASASTLWQQTKDKISAGLSSVQWNSNLIACMDASISKISWAAYIDQAKLRPWTLVHGDYHPANMMWNFKDKHIVLFDFEVVGLGSGPQDLGQFMISHTEPEERKRIEEELVRRYYQELISRGDEEVLNETSYSWDNCWRDYVEGGCERWVWLLALLSGICTDKIVQYFQDQVSAFMEDHQITPDNIGMPRV